MTAKDNHYNDYEIYVFDVNGDHSEPIAEKGATGTAAAQKAVHEILTDPQWEEVQTRIVIEKVM